MKEQLLFSVIVPVYNNASDLRRCLTALCGQTLERERYEIIVVDNNSTDGTAKVPLEFGIACLSEKDFQSSYAARNRGILAARGEFVAFTDSDCVPDPDWLRQISVVTSDETAGCFAGEILSLEPTTTVERFSDSIGLLRQKGPLSGWHFKPYAQTANAIYRKAVFERIGLFDPTTTSGGDAAIAWRMLDATSYKIRFVPEAIVYHHHRATVAELYSQFRRYGGGKMSWALAQKDYVPPAIEVLERGIVDLFTKHIRALEEAGVTDEIVFSALKSVSQAAHMSGYLQDLLRYTTDGAPLENAPAIARSRAASCEVCGSFSFLPGPAGRLAGGQPPQCRDCGSLERHRMLHRFLSTVEGIASMKCLSVGDALHKAGGIFKDHLRAAVDDVLLGNVKGRYDVVVCANLLTPTGSIDLTSLLDAVVRVLHEASILVLYVPEGSHRSQFFAADVSQHLPNVHVSSTTLADKATAAKGRIVIATPKGRFANLVGDRPMLNGLQPILSPGLA